MKGRIKKTIRDIRAQISVKPIPRTVRLEIPTKREGWRTKIHSPDGSTYTGDWHNSKKHGVGEYISPKKHLFNGYFVDNHPNKFGVSAFGNRFNTYRIEYRGCWKNGRFHGYGILHYRDESMFQGMFVEGSREGYGQMWYKNGDYYEGYWFENRRHGTGFFVEANGNRFEGDWLKDKKHGRGIFFFLSTGQYMTGVWDDNICVTSIMADIPYRQTSGYPTEYTINEIKLEEEDNFVIDMIESTLLHLPDAPEDDPPKKEVPVVIPLCIPKKETL